MFESSRETLNAWSDSQDAPAAHTRTTYVVAVYEEDQAYGGPEEGGWWFATGALVRVVRVEKDEDRAYAIAHRINRALDYKRRHGGGGRYPISSVCYEGGHLAARVYERTAPESYPEHRPHYE